MPLRLTAAAVSLCCLLAAAAPASANHAASATGSLAMDPPSTTPVSGGATDTAVATPGPDASSPAAGILPSLDELIARDRSAIAFAAAFGPNGPLPESPGVRLATPSEAMSQLIGAGHFEITFACGWGGSVSVSLEVPAELGGQGASPAPIGGACDGAIHQATVAVDHPSSSLPSQSRPAGGSSSATARTAVSPPPPRARSSRSPAGSRTSSTSTTASSTRQRPPGARRTCRSRRSEHFRLARLTTPESGARRTRRCV